MAALTLGGCAAGDSSGSEATTLIVDARVVDGTGAPARRAAVRLDGASDGELAGRNPRGYGTFPRVLGRYVHERGVVPLEEAVRRRAAARPCVTRGPARRPRRPPPGRGGALWNPPGPRSGPSTEE